MKRPSGCVKFGSEVGLFFYAGSATPLTTYVATTNQIPVMVEGRGDMGRTPFLTKTDLQPREYGPEKGL